MAIDDIGGGSGDNDIEIVQPKGKSVNSSNTPAKILSQLSGNGRDWFILNLRDYPSGIIRADEYRKIFDKKYRPKLQAYSGDAYIYVLERPRPVNNNNDYFGSGSTLNKMLETATGGVKALLEDMIKKNEAMKREWFAERGLNKTVNKKTGKTLTSEEVYTAYKDESPNLIPLNGANEKEGARIAKETGLTDVASAVVGVANYKGAIKHPKRTFNELSNAKDKAWNAYEKRNGKYSKEKWSKSYDTLAKNRATGLKFEKDFQKKLGGTKPGKAMKTKVTYRHVDNMKDGVARELKTGKVKLNNNIKLQIQKDKLLVDRELIEKAEWHFKDMPEKAVLDELTKNGIKYVVP